jgi:hypothetical protein
MRTDTIQREAEDPSWNSHAERPVMEVAKFYRRQDSVFTRRIVKTQSFYQFITTSNTTKT